MDENEAQYLQEERGTKGRNKRIWNQNERRVSKEIGHTSLLESGERESTKEETKIFSPLNKTEELRIEDKE